MGSENISAPTPPVGVIESFTVGFETVASRLVLLLLPLVLDLFLWVGPRLSYRPAFMSYYEDIWQPTMASFDEVEVYDEGGPSPKAVDPQEKLAVTWGELKR